MEVLGDYGCGLLVGWERGESVVGKGSFGGPVIPDCMVLKLSGLFSGEVEDLGCWKVWVPRSASGVGRYSTAGLHLMDLSFLSTNFGAIGKQWNWNWP